MSRYQYRAVDGRGNIVEGETTATSTSQAIAQLERQGLQVESISQVDTALIYYESLSSEEKIAVEQLRQQAVHNARSWSAPLFALSQEVNSRWLANRLSGLSSKLKDTGSLEQLARDSETAQVLPFVIKDLDADSDSESWLMKLTQQLQSRRNQRRDLLYPICSSLFLALILVVGAIWIIPTFRQMYEEFGLILPAPTMVLLTVSSWIYPHFLRSLLVLAVLVTFIVAIVRVVRNSGWLDRNVPWLVSGSNSNLRALGVLTQNLGELVSLKYPMAQSLRLAAQGCNHVHYKATAFKLADELETSGGPTSNLTKGTMPPLLLGVLSSGTAEAGTLRRIGGLYRDRERDGSRQFALVLSQFTLIGAGCIIGMVVIALFMPLIRLITALA